MYLVPEKVESVQQSCLANSRGSSLSFMMEMKILIKKTVIEQKFQIATILKYMLGELPDRSDRRDWIW